MQRRKNISLLISLAILTLASGFVYWVTKPDRNDVVDKNLFRVDDFEEIDRVEMKSATGQVVLKFADSRWRVNDQYVADRNMVDVLFATLRQAEPKRPVAGSMQDSVSQSLGRNGIQVSLYEGDQLRKEFIAGGNNQKTQAYFKEPNESVPYLMSIPGYRVYTSGIFELDENGWRDKYIFTLNWQNSFKSLEASFPDPRNNFTIIMENRLPVIRGMVEADTARLYTFLDDVSLLTADEFVPVNDSLWKGNAIMRIDIRDIAGRNYSLELYRGASPSAKFPGKVHETDAALFAAGKIEQIVKPRQFFERKK